MDDIFQCTFDNRGIVGIDTEDQLLIVMETQQGRVKDVDTLVIPDEHVEEFAKWVNAQAEKRKK